MSFLSSWLAQIVLILLFAVVLDLVVPASSMRNYVRLVMGLVIMVTMLKPISALYDNRFDLSRISWPELAAPGFDAIRSRAAELRREQVQQAEQTFSEQLEKTIKQQIETAYPLEVAQVQARLEKTENGLGETARIEELNVSVRFLPNGGAGRIEPVQPVVVQPDAAKHPGGQPADVATNELLQQVRAAIAERLQIPESVVSVRMEAQARG